MHNAPFGNRPTKPQAIITPTGKFAIFIGAGYEFTDRAGATRLRDALSALLDQAPDAAPADHDDSAFVSQLRNELRGTSAAKP